MWFFNIIIFAFFLKLLAKMFYFAKVYTVLCLHMCKPFFKEIIKEDSDLFSKVYGINVGV